MIILFTKKVQVYGHCFSGLFTSLDCCLNGMAALPCHYLRSTLSLISTQVPVTKTIYAKLKTLFPDQNNTRHGHVRHVGDVWRCSSLGRCSHGTIQYPFLPNQICFKTSSLLLTHISKQLMNHSSCSI